MTKKLDSLNIIRLCKEKNIYIYGFDEIARIIMADYIRNGLLVAGFIARESEKIYLGNTICGVEVLGVETIKDYDNDLVLYTKKEEGDVVKKIIGDRLETLWCFEVPEVVIYGAGNRGNILVKMFLKCGLKVLGLVDSDSRKIGEFLGDIEVTDLETVFIRNKNKALNFLISTSYDRDNITNIIKEKNPDVTIYECSGDPRIDLINGTPGFDSISLAALDLIWIISEIDSKKIVLWGNYKSICELSAYMKLIGVETHSAISIEGVEGIVENVHFINKYDLSYFDKEKNVIIFLGTKSQADEALNFVSEIGWSRYNITSLIEHNMQIDYYNTFDIHNGHSHANNNYFGIEVLNNNCNCPDIVIGVVGGSTSDVILYNEISWPEHLLKLFRNKGVNAEIIACGVSGYVSFQELIRICRDIIPRRPNIIISYSGVNDAITKAYDADNYQLQLYREISKHKPSIDRLYETKGCYSGEKFLINRVDNWIDNEIKMNAVSKAFGVEFFGILQPCLMENSAGTSKINKILNDYYLSNAYTVELDGKEVVSFTARMDFIKKASLKVKEIPFIYDFSNIFNRYKADDLFFDSVHLTTKGNEMVAEKVFDIVSKML
ncbi:SGNH/GDSL hydrolase family protein [Lachnospiraceae bacterium C1.1]|nr:hypothetical protein [Lachnospiraceae bacterium C1.1]